MSHARSVKWNKERAEFVRGQSNEFFAEWVEGRLAEYTDKRAAHDLREVARRLRGAPDPTTQIEVTDERREYVLTAIIEDMSRAEEGENPVCDRCGEAISDPRTEMYRCAECALPFHLHCILAHFADHGGGA